MAFLVCGEFCGESGLRKVGLGGIHPLTQRYTLYEESLKIQVKNRSFQCRFLGVGRQDIPVSILIFLGSWLSVGLPYIGGFLFLVLIVWGQPRLRFWLKLSSACLPF
ncbi:hypothetical protein ACUY8K_001915 [Vibrio parahaemolyticus]